MTNDLHEGFQKKYHMYPYRMGCILSHKLLVSNDEQDRRWF
jgi:hypothetical protein